MSGMEVGTSEPGTSRRASGQGAPRRRVPAAQAGAQASREAIRIVAVILQVLGGALAPAEAAALLEVSLPRYYALETRALQGMARGCEPRGAERRRSPERELAELRQEKERLERECRRQQALARAAQRSAGLLGAGLAERTKTDAKGKKRKRRVMPRGLRVARHLQERLAESGDPPVAPEPVPGTK
jgi:hypothetical protein